MNHILIFILGSIVGQFSLLFVIALCKAASDPAEDTYGRTCKHLMGGE